MRAAIRKLRATTTAGVCAVLLAGAVALAPAAAAVTPDTATAVYDCGIYGRSVAQLTADQSGSLGMITVVFYQITAPVSIPWSSIHSRLVLADTDAYTTRTFEGYANPDLRAGDWLTVGPLPGTVYSGDSLSASGGSLTMDIYGVRIDCTSSMLSPHPFIFD
ncbi:hypothetical protein [Streptomyces sp. YIM S03343]